MYTPHDGYEGRVPNSVIRYVAENGSYTNPFDLMVDQSYRFPVEFPYSPTDTNFASINIPKELDFLLKI